MRKPLIDAVSRPRLVDRLVDAYVDWRQACAWVNDSYRRCANEIGPRGRVAFGIYMAALDAEQQAAEVYAGLVRRAGELRWSEERAVETVGPAWRVGRP